MMRQRGGQQDGASGPGRGPAPSGFSRRVTVIGDTPRVDVFTVAWSVLYEEAAADATTFYVEGVPVPTVSIEHLITSKRTGRLQDAADIEVLEEIRRMRGG